MTVTICCVNEVDIIRCVMITLTVMYQGQQTSKEPRRRTYFLQLAMVDAIQFVKCYLL